MFECTVWILFVCIHILRSTSACYHVFGVIDTVRGSEESIEMNRVLSAQRINASINSTRLISAGFSPRLNAKTDT